MEVMSIGYSISKIMFSVLSICLVAIVLAYELVFELV